MKDTKENFTLLPTIDIFNEISKEMQIKGINCNIEQDVLKLTMKHNQVDKRAVNLIIDKIDNNEVILKVLEDRSFKVIINANGWNTIWCK